MGCCLSTEYQVDLVIAKFSKYYSQFTNLKANEFPQLVAGRILPVTTVLLAPVSGKRCVHYKVKAEELVHKTRHYNENGKRRTQHYTEWEYRYTDIRSVDFLLVDPANPSVTVYIPFSQTNHKLHCKTDAMSSSFQPNQNRPDSMMEMFARYGSHNHRATQWRYYESSFEYGEQVAVLGVIRDADGVPGGKMLHPMTQNILTEEYFKQNEWSSWDKSSWKDLTAQACIIVTDVPAFLKDKPIAPLTQNYAAPTFQHQMFIPGYTPQQPQQPQGPPPMNMGVMQNNNRVYPDPNQQYTMQQQQQQQQQGGVYSQQQPMMQQQGGGYPMQQQQQGFAQQQGFPQQQGGFYPQQQQQQQQQVGGFYPQPQGQQVYPLQQIQQQLLPAGMFAGNSVHPYPQQQGQFQ